METFAHRRPNASEVLFRAVSKACDSIENDKAVVEPKRGVNRKDIESVHDFFRQRRLESPEKQSEGSSTTDIFTEPEDLPAVLPTCIPVEEHIQRMSWEKPEAEISERYRVEYDESKRRW